MYMNYGMQLKILQSKDISSNIKIIRVIKKVLGFINFNQKRKTY